MIAYIDAHKDQFGVEPICTVLTEADAKIAPSTYYAATSAPPSKRAVADAALDTRITDLFEKNYRVYGVHKMWKALNRQPILDEHGEPTDRKCPPVPRCTAAVAGCGRWGSKARSPETTRSQSPRSPGPTTDPRTP